ncbi:SMP-30/gluconolactonase/LRE family protein [Polymorphobacter sp. PAMC 29334]|uniref:glycosyl hydrolase family 28-related protein n=1 Tax=Polymorphobacter sp. PAMC 29334 TaxID=2862331 RepID=UPI001C73EC3E|nr:glycosyl hydrolase family 28-related protein [Polymorphobacter sp. PAMC 29334]QYE36570.1 SMP-30/gluconolactonase/LRE family protein [Polymorphobacter sp. PAMC 29334]
MIKTALVLALAAAPTAAIAGPSVFQTAPDDARAVTVAGRGDGRADDGAALQSAIDSAAAKGGGGIVFVPSGRYRITRTIFLWPGVRVFGVGATRPVIVLGDKTPGFQRGIANMLFFAGARRGEVKRVAFPPPGSVPFDPGIADATPSTFYSALSNVDFAIGKGNTAATAIRFHAAQHAYLSHIDFDLGSGLAGIYQVANLASDLHFRGGRYGILTENTSPAWQFTLLDSTFDGQRDAAIREHQAGLTLVNVAIRNVPVGIDIDAGYNDWLWGKNVRFDRIARAGVVISNEASAYTQIGIENAVATATPVFASFRDSGKTVPGKGASYRVAAFNHGLAVPSLGEMGKIATVMTADPLASAPPAVPPALPSLPATGEWTNVRTLGAKGDNATDDTAALQKAIDSHRVLYFPAGRYVVSETLRLKPDTVLIGLHPSLTQIVLPDHTPAYQGVGAAKAVIASAAGGNAIVSGLGIATGGINARATGLLWTAGAGSLVEDVKFQGGHGTDLPDGTRADPYNANHSGDPDPMKRWDAQYPSLWVTRGGGGTFSNIWSPNTYAQSGMYVSDTTTPGHVYELSSEHHVRTEIVLDRVANWELLAPQTEEESGEGQDTVSLEIQDSHDILVANYHAYRVTRTVKPAASAVKLYNSAAVHFRNVHVNAESGIGLCDDEGCATYLRASKFPYSDAIQDVTHGLGVREREFATLDVPAAPAAVTPSIYPAGAKLDKLADGFYSISGAAAAPDGTLYFVDHRQQRIYGWSDARKLTIVQQSPLDPVNLAVARSGDLLVLSSDGHAGSVYSFKPGGPDGAITVIAASDATVPAGARTLLPVNTWTNGEFKDQIDPQTLRFPTLAAMFTRDMAVAKLRHYVSPDGSLMLPAYRAIRQGPDDFRGWRFSDSLDTYGFAAEPGARVFVTNGSEDRTYSATVGQNGVVTNLRPFADRGGESVVAGKDGRVYVANGQVFVYDSDGREIGRIDVPDRPLQLVFGGKDNATLFILTHHALYGLRPAAP